MGTSAPYRRVRERLTELASTIDDTAAQEIVPATPLWTVKDVYAHLAGSCDDILGGRLEGVTSDPWTQAQVDARSGASLTEIVAEWNALAPRIDEAVDALGDAMDARFFIDAWTHEQDLRSLRRVSGGADDPLVGQFAPAMLKGFCVRVRRAGLPPILVQIGDATNQSGDNPEHALTATPYEFLRGVLGRRSRGQLAAWNWSAAAPVEEYIDALIVFGMAEIDIVDAV